MAGGNYTTGVMTLLLDRQGEEVKVTEEVTKVPAENGKIGLKLMMLLRADEATRARYRSLQKGHAGEGD